MFSADEKTIAELRDLRECLAAIDPAEATVLGLALEGELSRRTPDLTRVLLRAADSAGKHGLALGRTLTAACCRAFCARLGDLHPGAAIEVRVPPYGVTQAVAGTVHRRGTPPSVVETDAETWLALVTGRLTWADAVAGGALRASGERCDLSAYLPLLRT